jgi:Tol biopolymer transport system component
MGSSYFPKYWDWRQLYHDGTPVLVSEPGLIRLTNEAGDDVDGAWQPDGSQIVWVTDRLENWTIWVMDSNGSDKKQLTDDGYLSGTPAWSPDGEKILFWSDMDGQSDLWLMNPDGTEKTKVTNDNAFEGVFGWSPGGDLIAFDSNRTGNWEIWTTTSSGDDASRLTVSDGECYFTSWSPDGSEIGYWCILDSGCDSWVMRRDGSEQTRLTSSSFCEILPKYSPDMTEIVYLSIPSGSHYELWSMSKDGGGGHRLSVSTKGDRGYTYSPENGKLLYWGFIEEQYLEQKGDPVTIPTADVLIADASGEHLLTFNEANDMCPSWSPDGETVLFESDRYGDFDLVTIPAIAPSVEVRIVDVDFPGDVYVGEEFRLNVGINYTFPEETYVMVAVRDWSTRELIASEQLELRGQKMVTTEVSVPAPLEQGQWQLRVEAYYLQSSVWVHSGEEWYHIVGIQVIPEFCSEGAGILMVMGIMVIVFLIQLNRLDNAIRKAEQVEN